MCSLKTFIREGPTLSVFEYKHKKGVKKAKGVDMCNLGFCFG